MSQSEHTTRLDPITLKPIYSSVYRTNGYQEISGNGGKSTRYGDLLRIQRELQKRGTDAEKENGQSVPKGSLQHAGHYTFTYGVNFTRGSAPYANQGHHLIPCEAFGDKYFNAEQRELMLRVDWDINNGKNIIFLPENLADCEFHDLPQHYGSHPGYDDLVDGDMKDLKQSLDQTIAEDPEHKNFKPGDIKNQLLQLQDQYWDYLTGCGQIPINTFAKPEVI